jgi:hypothetical protein
VLQALQVQHKLTWQKHTSLGFPNRHCCTLLLHHLCIRLAIILYYERRSPCLAELSSARQLEVFALSAPDAQLLLFIQQTCTDLCCLLMHPCSVRVMPDGQGMISSTLQGLQQCVNELDRRKAANAVPDMKLVVSMSLGSSAEFAKPLWDAAINQMTAQRSDILLVAAAGNSGVNGEAEYPAGQAQVLAVAAVDSNGVVASFSTRQSYVAIAGPGTVGGAAQLRFSK